MNDPRPLYAQIRDGLVARLMAGEWPPGTALPSEIALAEALGVSQGTVRKALDGLCADGALERSQGRGTFVPEQTPERANFHFFRLINQLGERALPELARQNFATIPARNHAAALQITPEDRVHVIDRLRTIEGVRAILETVIVPAALMPDLGERGPLPNALYPHYQELYGISVLRAEDALDAVAADHGAAMLLSVPVGSPLLRATRTAYDLAERLVEHRISRFLTSAYSYAITLR